MLEPSEKTAKIAAQATDMICGIWSGATDVAGTSVALVLHIERTESGLSVVADFPQLGRSRMPFADASFELDTLRFTSRSLGIYAGRLSSDGMHIEGSLANRDQCSALILRSGAGELAEPARPQTPQPPFGYAIEPVHFDNLTAQCRLAGTLTVPADRSLRAIALLIPGSGAMDRDETVFGHKPFWVLADHLSRNGYAVLRVDDRGVGESDGDRSMITMQDEMDDLMVAVDYLQQRSDLRGLPIGLIGHSMGSTHARIVAAQRTDIAFLVSMAGAGVAPCEVFVERDGHSLRQFGLGEEAIVKHGEFARALFQYLRDRPAGEPIDAAQIDAIAAPFGAADTLRKLGTHAWVQRYNEAWFRSALRVDPQQALPSRETPVLAIHGSLDRQVPATSNLAAIAQMLEASSHPDFEIVELPGLNHLFQTCATGEAYEYPIIEETMAPRVLDTIRTWLDARFQPLRSA